MIKRKISHQIESHLFKGKAILIYGARQTGKTTLVEELLKSGQEKLIRLSGDDPGDRSLLENFSSSRLRSLTAGYGILFIDEAQKFNDIGNIIKIFTDQIKNVQVIATGSSSFDLLGRTSESLTGRKYEFNLYPLMFSELIDHHGFINEKKSMEDRLIFGSYPEVVTNQEERKVLITSLAGSHLYKDVLMVDRIRNSVLIDDLLRALALQTGSEVSSTELSRLTGADRGTIDKYLRILEEAFIIFRLRGFSRNVRTELRKAKKYYFWDNGIRNALIGNFNPLSARTDTGALWENYIISERMKLLRTNRDDVFTWFWRTTQQQEIDLLEERQGRFSPIEIKYNPKQKGLISKTFTENYDVSQTFVVNSGNYEAFLYPELFSDNKIPGK